MTDYTKSTNFASKDSLPSGNPLKIVKGTEIDTEFNNIATAVSTKADYISPTLVTPVLGTPTSGILTNCTGLPLTTGVTGTLPVANGGTGATTLTGILKGNGTSAVTAVTAPTGTIVGTTDTQTLTNKTLTSPTITGAVVSSMASSVISSGTSVASTSGTSIDFTSIPSWVKRITVMFVGVSTTGTSIIQVQIGSGSVVTTGYLGGTSSTGSTTNNITSGFGFATGIASTTNIVGTLTMTLVSGNTWLYSSISQATTAIQGVIGAGYLSLGGTLDRVRITTVNGTDTFDAGSINILYE